MSTPVRTDPSLLDGLLQECLAAILSAHPGQDPIAVDLSRFDQTAYHDQRPHIPALLRGLVESKSEALTIRSVDPVVIAGPSLGQAVYFVRCSSYNGEVEPITRPSSDMVLFEFNPHRKVLTVGKLFADEDLIESTLAKRAAQERRQHHPTTSNGDRRQEVADTHAHILRRLEFYLDKSDDEFAKQRWRHILQQRHSVQEITIQDVLVICSLIGVPYESVFSRPPVVP